MRHYLLPFLRPRYYRTGLQRWVYHGDKNKTRMIHLLWLLALILVPVAFYVPRFVPQQEREAATNSPDVDTSLPIFFLFIIGWFPTWHYAGRLGDRMFIRKVRRRYGRVDEFLMRLMVLARRRPVKIDWAILESDYALRMMSLVRIKWRVLERH